MSTYGQLKTDIADWLARGDLTAKIPTFVLLAENDIDDELRIRDMIRRARANGDDTRYLALPDGYLEMRRLNFWPDSARYYSLIQVTPENLQILNMRDTSTSSYNYPQRYTVHREIEFDVPVATDGEIEMIYYKRYAALADDADTNWVLQNAYGVYLYGALKQTAPYIRDDGRIATWEAGYRNAVNSTMRTELRSRVNKGEARVSVSGATP